MLTLIIQEIDFLFPFGIIDFLSFLYFLLKRFLLIHQLDSNLFQLGFLLIKLLDLLLQICLSNFALQLFSHAECNRALVKGLVGSYGHFKLISHSQQQNASLRTVDRYLPDNFIKTLAVELFSDRANSRLPGLPV